jgi:hypothetical protein
MRWLTLTLAFAVAGCGGHADAAAREDLWPRIVR